MEWLIFQKFSLGDNRVLKGRNMLTIRSSASISLIVLISIFSNNAQNFQQLDYDAIDYDCEMENFQPFDETASILDIIRSKIEFIECDLYCLMQRTFMFNEAGYIDPDGCLEVARNHFESEEDVLVAISIFEQCANLVDEQDLCKFAMEFANCLTEFFQHNNLD
ncbi:uncharacterized protein LOC119669934 [Teleopsis dalmanni]|uniref:uncharacterized protein LOC119669934 n=1 Tax=Teleopsis dalmanni TaxID=139649 RepID=UPI0018CE13F1|nr:uncharacterized protein LOC119669934 [Teleopsis dalmanni]